MRRNPDTWPVYTVNMRKTRIDPSPPYQRGLVWSRPKKQLFIDSMLRDFDVPKLYLRRVSDSNSAYEWEVVDGQQRLNAIWEFLGNEYPISRDADPLGDHMIAGRLFDELDSRVQDQLHSYNLSLVELDEAEDHEIEEMFIRLQNGVPLNAAEKRNAIAGGIRDFVRGIASQHSLLTQSVPFPGNRFAHDEAVAQMLLIELRGGPTPVTSAKLSGMYDDGEKFAEGSPDAVRFKRVLNFLAQAFPQRTPELRKATVISLYTVASETLAKYAIQKRARGFGKWFVDFERRRREEENKPEDEMDPEMQKYQTALLQGSASLGSQKIRRDVLVEDLLASITDLALLDDRRLFTNEQRIAIFRKADEKCANPDNNPDCVGECKWDDFHADHIVPHSAGGKTVVSNGQLLCPSCNLKKSDKQPGEA